MIKSTDFLEAKAQQVQEILKNAESFSTFSKEMLMWKPAPSSWNILECLEHLNLYGDYYLLEIEKKMAASGSTADVNFKSGILGKYFSESMLPKEKLNKMNTFKDKNPVHTVVREYTISRFIQQQHTLLELLQKASKVSLNKVKIETSLTRFLRLKLGDTFEFYINHMIRHMQQIEKLESGFKKQH